MPATATTASPAAALPRRRRRRAGARGPTTTTTTTTAVPEPLVVQVRQRPGRIPKSNDDDDGDTDASPGIRGMLDAAAPASDDDDNDASPGIRGMQQQQEHWQQQYWQHKLSMRLCPHLGSDAPNRRCGSARIWVAMPGAPVPTHVRSSISVCSCRSPRRRSRFSVDGGKAGTPGSPAFLPTGGILRDNSRRMFGSASSRIRELIRFQNVHCEIVHRLGSELKGAGCAMHPASEISVRSSCPTHLGCMLGLMSAEQIRQYLR